MAFPTPNRTNLTRQALNTPARQRLAAMRGRMFPNQNPALRPPAPAPAPRMAAAAPPPQQPQAPQPRAATSRSNQQRPANGLDGLQGLSIQGPIDWNAAGQKAAEQWANSPAQITPARPPQSTPPDQVGPGEISPEDVENAPYMNEEYFRTDASETRRREQQLAAINQQRQALGIGYGLGEFGGDAETNPYSRAALLQRSYERNQRASTNSMAAAGQLYSGSLSNARNFNRFNYDVGYDSMRKQYDAALARLNQQELDANTRYDDAIEAALRDAVNQGQRDGEPTPEEAGFYPDDDQGGNNQGGNNGAGGGNRPRPKQVGKASKKRITTARKRIKKLRQARSKARNPKQRQRITKRIQKNKQVVNRNQKRLQNIKQGKPPNQGIKPRPKPKKGKK